MVRAQSPLLYANKQILEPVECGFKPADYFRPGQTQISQDAGESETKIFHYEKSNNNYDY